MSWFGIINALDKWDFGQTGWRIVKWIQLIKLMQSKIMRLTRVNELLTSWRPKSAVDFHCGARAKTAQPKTKQLKYEKRKNNKNNNMKWQTFRIAKRVKADFNSWKRNTTIIWFIYPTCIALHCIGSVWIALHCIALHCIALDWIGLKGSGLHDGHISVDRLQRVPRVPDAAI